jgi:hypothetical protein
MSKHHDIVAVHNLKADARWGIAIVRNTYPTTPTFLVARVNPKNSYLPIAGPFATEAAARKAANTEWLSDNNALLAKV